MRSVTPQCCPPGWAKKMSVILLLVATLAAGSVSGVGYREIFDPADDTPDTALAGTMPLASIAGKFSAPTCVKTTAP